MHADHHHYQTFFCTACGHDFKAPVRCGNRLCPICSTASRYRVRARMRSLVASQPSYPTYSFKHLTLSVTNSPDLAAAHRHLSASFRRLRQRALWRRTVLGGCFVFEVAGRPHNWHLHIHACLFARFIPWSLLHSSWQSTSGGNAVYIKTLPPLAIINYLSSYLTTVDLPAESIEAAGTSLPNLRLFTVFGSWHALNLRIKPIRNVCPNCGNPYFIPSRTLNYLKRTGIMPRRHTIKSEALT